MRLLLLLAETWSYESFVLEVKKPQSLSCHTPWTFCQGCCISQGLGKTLELLACVLANRFKGPRLPSELVHSHCFCFPASHEEQFNVHPASRPSLLQSLLVSPLISRSPPQFNTCTDDSLDATALARSAVCVRCASSSPQYAVRLCCARSRLLQWGEE